MATDLFHRFWRGVLILFLALTTLVAPSGRAEAFSGSAISAERTLGRCLVGFDFDPVDGNAQVQLLEASQFAGGSYFNLDGIRTLPSGITAAAIESFCGYTDVVITSQNGADGSFATDGYIGITFSATMDSTRYDYEFALKEGGGGVEVVATEFVDFPKSDVSSLASLSLLNVNLSPVFDPTTTGYTATVANSVTDTVVIPGVADFNSTVTINGVPNGLGSAAPVGLDPGPNTIIVEVTAEDGEHVTAYTITVTREAPPPPPPPAPKSNVATLFSLSLDGVLSPQFASDVTDYTATVAADASSTIVTPTVTATMSVAQATVTLNGSPIPSGLGASVTLNPGTNIIALEVTAEDGVTKKTYRITITKPQPNRAPIANPDYWGGQAGQTVTLTGVNAVDPDTGNNTGLTFLWQQIDLTPGVPTVTLSGANGRDATFTAPELEPGAESITLRFNLTVSDGALSNTMPVSVTIFAPRIALPESEAVAKVLGKTAVNGTYTLTSGEVVTLSAADSTLPRDATPVYSWASDAPGVTFGSPDAMTTSFTAPVVTVPTEVEVALNISFGKILIDLDFAAASLPAIDIDDIGPPRDEGLRAVLTITVLPAVTEPPAETPTPEEIEAARQEVVKFVQTRTSLLLSNQPDMDDMLLNGPSDGTANLTVSSMGGQADISTAPDKTVWLRLKGAWSTVDGAEGDYILGSVGAHLVQGNGFAFGIMAQVDHLKTVDGLSVGEGTGWLAGPYAVVALQSHPVTVQGRLLYGRTDNTQSPTGTYEDKFSGDRLLALLGVSGEVARGKLTLKPTLSAGYVRETTDAYVNGAGIAVPETATALIQIAPGIEVSFPVEVSSGSMELTFGLADVWSGSATGDASSFEGHRGRISAGIKRVFDSGATLSASATYDGIGASTYESLSVDVLLRHQF